ncbi:MAG: sigma-70 family RNA polymerase sigma factor [Acidimicrobiia bacterium]|nr:sigma-70 family RNA polymerase sigma factor [Acidimicrobiia bacterium]
MELGTTAVSVGELLSACRDGDAEAWSLLVDRYHNLVYAIAVREGLSPEDSADLTQSTFEALLAQLDRIRDDEKVASWLMTVARRKAWRVRSRRGQQTSLPEESMAVATDWYDDDPADDVSRMLWVYEALSQLDDKCRNLITVLYFDPRSPSYAEIAARLRRPVGSIGPSRARCLARLRLILGEVASQ